MRQYRSSQQAVDDTDLPAAFAPGKRARTDDLAPSRRETAPVGWLGGEPADSAATSAADPAAVSMSGDESFVDSLVGPDRATPLQGAASSWGERLGVDLAAVRVHQGGAASTKVEAHGARAMADGDDIFLGAGERPDDLELLGHEVAHVAQTRGGAVSGARAKLATDAGLDRIEREADRAGHALAHSSGAVDVAVAAPARPHFEKKPAESGNAATFRVALRSLGAEASQVYIELDRMDDGPAKESRRIYTLARINSDLMLMANKATALTTEEREALAPSMGFVVQRAGRLAPTSGTRPTLAQIKGLLESWAGRKFGYNAPNRAESDPEETLEVVASCLTDAENQLAEAVAASTPSGGKSTATADASGNLGIARLVAARYLMRGAVGSDDIAEREKLQPLVKKLVKHTKVLQSRYGKGPRVRELRVRLSDVCEQVYLDRLVDEGMDQILTEETFAGRGYDEKQLARFNAAVELWREALRSQYKFQELAAEEIKDESKVVDPPKKPPLWQTLALAALKGATGGAVGIVIDMVADGAIGTDKELENVKGGKGFKSILGDAVKGVAGEVIDLAFEEASSGEDIKSGAEGGTARSGGGGTSTDPKTAFFAGQTRALAKAQGHAQTAAIKKVLALHTTDAFASDPESAIRMIESYAAAVPAAESDISNEQRAHTRAKFAAFLVGNTYLDDAVAVKTPEAYNGFDLENVHNIAGMVSMEFRRGATPDDPVKVTSAWIKGVNKPMRDQLVEMELATMGVPMRARGIVKGGGEVGVASVVSDQGHHVATGTGPAVAWLVAKGGGDADNREAAYEAAARKILDEEIGTKSLKDHGVELDD